jgi:hypothetical protein
MWRQLITLSANRKSAGLARREYAKLARTGAERRAGAEAAGAHTEARAERWGHVAKIIAAAGATPVVAEGNSLIGAHPLTARFAKRIDALHGEAGQVLHPVSL